MNRFPRGKTLLAVGLGSLVLSALILLMTTDTILNVSAVETSGVGVYWDYECTSQVTSIDWGTLQPGSDMTVTVYVQNEGTNSTFLTMTTNNWNPTTASRYITLEWDYSQQEIGSGETLMVAVTLSVSRYIRDISSFSFDILIVGPHGGFDLNLDGIVDIYDLVIVALAYGSYEGHPRWNQLADVNGDGVVDIFDLVPIAFNLDMRVPIG